MKTYEESRAEILSLPDDERRDRLFWLEVLWDNDWDILQGLFIAHNYADAEIDQRKASYYENCRRRLREDFGHEPTMF